MIKILTFLGTMRYQENNIHIDDFCMFHRIFPVALTKYYLKSVSKKSLKLIFFLTHEAKTHDNWLKYTRPDLERIKVNYDIVGITADMEPIELVKKMLDVVKEGDEVILDTTHSFRNIPITASIISLYLREVKNAKVRILYGWYDRELNATKAFDMTNIVEMADWLYAARLFREYGYSKPLGELVKNRNISLYKNKDIQEKPKKLGSLQDALRDLSDALRLGSIKSIRKSVRKLLRLLEDPKGLAMKDLEKFTPELYPLIPSMVEKYKKLDTEKESIELDEKELEAERELLKFYLDTEDLGMALRLAREYIVNVTLYKQGQRSEVLNRKIRESVIFPEENLIREARNHVAHFGFNKDELPSSKKTREHLRGLLERSLDELFETHQKVNINSVKAVFSPLGTSKGALFTVLKHFNPDVLVVITSKQAAENVDEIIEKANFKGKHYVVLVNDPFTGVDEIDKVTEEIRKYLEDNNVKDIVVNLTGGTSLLGYIAELVKEKIRYGRRITTVLAVDRRPYEEQKENPYIVGEILELPRE
ncbi:MAG TPA: CRISPR-associated DxTHG motif protein [Thermotogaceae bacterium]|nr:CRISPR-associated DxTHG motif protein [Thermotogaceae bacterium]